MKDKIRALLALAADPGAAPQESESAARMAAKLMAKHEISLGDLEEAALKVEYDLTTMEAMGCRPGKRNPKVVPPWIGIIAWGVKIYTRTRIRTRPGAIYFMGPREDVELAVWLHNTLLTGAYRSSEAQMHPNAYRNGYAASLQSRLKAMSATRQQVDREESTGTSLVLVQTRRQEIMNQEYGPESNGKSSKITQSLQGREAGMKAHIPQHRPIGGSNPRALS